MDNIREITSAKRVKLSVNAENRGMKTDSKQNLSLQIGDLQKFITAQINESISAAGAVANNKKSFLKKIRRYIELKRIVHFIIYGIITATGGTIATFKWSQIHSYTSFIPDVIQAKGALNEMYSLCYEPLPWDVNQSQKFLQDKEDFNKYSKNIVHSGYYSFKRVIFGKNISAKETEITNDLMNINTKLRDCSSIKALNPAVLDTKESETGIDMMWSIALRWPPFLF